MEGSGDGSRRYGPSVGLEGGWAWEEEIIVPLAASAGLRFWGLDVDKRGQIPWIWVCGGFGVARMRRWWEQDLRLHCATGDIPAL